MGDGHQPKSRGLLYTQYKDFLVKVGCVYEGVEKDPGTMKIKHQFFTHIFQSCYDRWQRLNVDKSQVQVRATYTQLKLAATHVCEL